MPEESRTVSRRREPKGPFDELKQFIGVCAKARREYSPEFFKENVGRKVGEFLNGMDDDSKALVNDVASIFRRPK